MLNFLTHFASNTWALVAEMAPYLIFGFAVAGLLQLLIKPAWVRRWLGKPGLSGVVKASLIGVPMPLCSCSVIPVAASIRQSGAGKGATAAFLGATPQIGVGSILATYALLGGLFTAVRIGVAFVSGVIAGFLIDTFVKEKRPQPAAPAGPALPPAPAGGKANFAALSFEAPPAASKPACCQAPATSPTTGSSKPTGETFSSALRYGFITLPANLASALLLGFLLAGLITTLLPDDLFTGAMSSGWLAFLSATAISLPLYVCSTGSIPMAYALMAAGLSPGAALVFLIVGPATNTTTIVAVWKMLGRSATFIYLASLVLTAWLAGWLFNAGLKTASADPHHHHHSTHEGLHIAPWQHPVALVFLALLIAAVWIRRSERKTAKADDRTR